MYDLLGIKAAKLIKTGVHSHWASTRGLQSNFFYWSHERTHLACASGTHVWNPAENPGEAQNPSGSCCWLPWWLRGNISSLGLPSLPSTSSHQFRPLLSLSSLLWFCNLVKTDCIQMASCESVGLAQARVPYVFLEQTSPPFVLNQMTLFLQRAGMCPHTSPLAHYPQCLLCNVAAGKWLSCF